uniref:Uncharacterized protein n=1 Tax=Brassica campestris TaxID=3711 RepID=A0A3P5ZR44_BRACM|nr:unnamed protein product [Brassica rapa]
MLADLEAVSVFPLWWCYFSRNVKGGDELMGVDKLLLDSKQPSYRHRLTRLTGIILRQIRFYQFLKNASSSIITVRYFGWPTGTHTFPTLSVSSQL